jgi:hypothetical protein
MERKMVRKISRSKVRTGALALARSSQQKIGPAALEPELQGLRVLRVEDEAERLVEVAIRETRRERDQLRHRIEAEGPIGRPLKDGVPGKRVSLGLKVTSDLKRQLDRAARSSGRTQSQEAEMRIARSFERQGLLEEVLSLAYGGKIAKHLIELGAVLSGRGIYA